MNLVLENLYLGDKTAAHSDLLLAKHEITHILNVTKDIPNKYPGRFVYKQVLVDDDEGENLLEVFE